MINIKQLQQVCEAHWDDSSGGTNLAVVDTIITIQELDRKVVPGKGLELRIYHPKQVRPDAPSNQELEGLVNEVVSHVDHDDLLMRFFGFPNVEAIAARITGRELDPYEQPRDTVIVAFNGEQPVGYTDIVEDTSCEQTAEFSMLIHSEMQRQGIGEAMIMQAVEETRRKGIRHLKANILQNNYKMGQALKKWTEDLHIDVRKVWEEGELTFVLTF